jgi:ABC-type multidrug transport system fused ATPase/permease subunit
MPFFKPLHQLCDPAKLYLVISVVSILASLMADSILGVSIHAVSVLLWAFLLGWLCDQGHPGVSWFLVLALPILMLIILIIGVIFIGTRTSEERQTILSKMSKQGDEAVDASTGKEESKEESKEERKEESKEESKDKEGMGDYDSETFESMSINNPQQLAGAVSAMMNMNEGMTSSNLNEAFGPLL